MIIDHDDEPTVVFYCEQCCHEFDVWGITERTDDEGGLEFIPNDASDEPVYCPDDLAYEFNESPTHTISLGA